MQGLQRKQGQGLDLRSFGNADIKRVSLVEWDQDQQRWYIIGQRGTMTDVQLSLIYVMNAFDMKERQAMRHVVSLIDSTRCVIETKTTPLYFDEYDDAVKVEIAFYDQCRKTGRKDVF